VFVVVVVVVNIIITRVYVDLCLCTVQLNKLFTIAVVQPDVVADDKIDLILEKVIIVFFHMLFHTLMIYKLA